MISHFVCGSTRFTKIHWDTGATLLLRVCREPCTKCWRCYQQTRPQGKHVPSINLKPAVHDGAGVGAGVGCGVGASTICPPSQMQHASFATIKSFSSMCPHCAQSAGVYIAQVYPSVSAQSPHTFKEIGTLLSAQTWGTGAGVGQGVPPPPPPPHAQHAAMLLNPFGSNRWL